MRSITTLLERYFLPVWPPFFLYLFIYLVARSTNYPISNLTILFQYIHIAHALGLICFIAIRLNTKAILPKEALFYVGLFFLFLIPGAYLEFPSDPWEHFRRIMSFSYTNQINQSEVSNRFAYFFSWTLISELPLEYRRIGLSFVAAFWQWALTMQLVVLLKQLGLNKERQYLGVIAWVCFFGTGLFGMRYYALSSTPLAILAMFGGFSLVVKFWEGNKKSAFALPMILALIQFNHTPQELVNFLIGAIAISGFALWSRLTTERQEKYLRIAVKSIIIVCIVGIILRYIGPKPYRNFIHSGSSLAFWGGVPFSTGGPRILSTLGLHGLLGLIAAILLFKKYPYLCVLSLAPIGILFFPISAQLIKLVAGTDVSFYRILYGFPISICFGIYFYELLLKFQKDRAFFYVVGGMLAFGLMYFKPFYGRFFFQVYPQDKLHTLHFVDETARWFLENRPEQIGSQNCRLYLDEVTSFPLLVQMGVPHHGVGRLNPVRDIIDLSYRYDLLAFLDRKKVCGVLVADKRKIPAFKKTFIGSVSGHWKTNLVDLKHTIPIDLNPLRWRLIKANWTLTKVPPFYLYFEPPNE